VENDFLAPLAQRLRFLALSIHILIDHVIMCM